jgi:hypothetical protein
MYLESRGLAANTINQQLAAVRRLAHEAADSGLLSPELAAGISRVKGVKQLGFRSGNWLHRVGTDVLPPVAIQQVQPESATNQQVAQSSGKPKVKEGTVILEMVVGIEGRVQDRTRGSLTRRCARPEGNRSRPAMDVLTSTDERLPRSRSD